MSPTSDPSRSATLDAFGQVRSRRAFLNDAAAGLGAVALNWMLSAEARAEPHFPPKVRRVIQVFAVGGVSHVDTFDYKPELDRRDGQELTNKGTLDPFIG